MEVEGASLCRGCAGKLQGSTGALASLSAVSLSCSFQNSLEFLMDTAIGHVGSHVHRPHFPQFQSLLQVQSSPAGQGPVGFGGGLGVLGGVLGGVVGRICGVASQSTHFRSGSLHGGTCLS